MGILEKLKQMFSTAKSTFNIPFDTVDDLVEYAVSHSQCHDLSVYYYTGTRAELVSTISQLGEKRIPDMCLGYVEDIKTENNNLIMEDAMFFSDTMLTFITKYSELDLCSNHLCLYKTYNNMHKTVKNGVIGKNGVYLCSE